MEELIYSRHIQQLTFGTHHDLLMYKFQVKVIWKRKANQFLQYSLDNIPTIFKENMRNHFAVITFINRKLEKLWNLFI